MERDQLDVFNGPIVGTKGVVPEREYALRNPENAEGWRRLYYVCVPI
jgi:hypothetical protein